jgi:hypothetical protein
MLASWNRSSSVPNKNGESRCDGIKDFYAIMAKTRIPFGPTFCYAYDLLVDANGALLPAASAVATPKVGK